MKADANETLLLVGVTLFWAAILPIASVFLALAVLWDWTQISLRRGQSAGWGGVLSQFQLEEMTRRIRPRL
jgi:hypothetical protein